MKRGTKRPALADRTAEPSSSASIGSKKVIGATDLDSQRAESSRQHVRALNTQFAKWVQLQLQNHPDELWEDGVTDYLSHASSIMEKFKDVVDWLRANAEKSGNVLSVLASVQEQKSISGVTETNKTMLWSDKDNGPANAAKPPSIFQFSSNQPQLFTSSSKDQKDLLDEKSKPSIFSFSTVQSSSQAPPPLSSSTEQKDLLAEKSNKPNLRLDVNNGFSNNKPVPTAFSFSSSTQNSNSSTQNTVPFSFGQTQNSAPFSFGQSAAPSGTQSSNTASKIEASGDDDEQETEEQKPSSPSVKKTEEKGVVIVHETKCKVYIKPEDPAEKGWKDMGMGQLSIKSKEGVLKATKDSKPTIVIRNEVGKILLNALIYPGIKTNIQKNTVASIFHTSDESGSNVVARTYLLRLKNVEEATKLADVIKENAPSD